MDAKASGVRRMDGEIAVLRYVHARLGPSNTCFLVIDYESERFVGHYCSATENSVLNPTCYAAILADQ